MLSQGRFASVLVDAGGPAARRPFDYAIPGELGDHVRPGTLVVVPFGSRYLRGLVVDRHDCPAVQEPRPLQGLYRASEHADPRASELAAYVAGHYACSEIEAYRAVLPAVIGGRSVRAWVLGAQPPPEPGSLAAELQAVYGLVRERRRVTLTNVASTLGLTRREAGHRLGRLVAAGLLESGAATEKPVAARGRPRFVPAAGAPERRDELRRARAPKQLAVFEELLAVVGAVEAEDLTGDAASVRRSLKALVAKGLVVTVNAPAAAAGPAELESLGGSATPLTPSPAQQAAIEAIEQRLSSGTYGEFLLHGVTGSGKTEVYLQVIATALALGRQALVLVPEISLTPQAAARFERRFAGQVALLHSGLPAGERTAAWRRLRSGSARIAVGPRSAVFAPLPQLGLVVVDEEHESSYKQEDIPRYDARAVARYRAVLAGAPVVYGSATPSLELYARAHGLVQAASDASALPAELLSIPGRLDERRLPRCELVDMRDELKSGNRSVISHRLAEELALRLERGQQSILFLNRRGLSTFVLCRECGRVERCPSCDVSLVFHGQENALRCHYCGYSMLPPTTCAGCGGTRIRYFGAGTQRVEQQVSELFPDATVARLDSDVAERRGRVEATFDAFARGRIDVLVGTQMIGKGLDVPAVTLVGVVAADISLGFPDFRAAERTFGLVTQVAGRAGRGDDEGLVIVQTYNPDHYSLAHAMSHDYAGFAAEELEFRRQLDYPPFAHLAIVRLSGESEGLVHEGAIRAGEMTRDLLAGAGGQAAVLGPAPSPLYRLQGRYRWNIVIKGKNRTLLAASVRELLDQLQAELGAGVRVGVDLDPQSVL